MSNLQSQVSKNEKVQKDNQNCLEQIMINETLEDTSIIDINHNKEYTVLPVEMKWKEINKVVTLPKSGEDKVLLNKVNGFARCGEVHAIMGPSGSGKTTLLNILGGRTKKFTGDITMNGKKFTKADKRRLCYVLQYDVMFENLKVRDQILYSALLQCPNTMSRQDKEDKVDEVLHELGIDHVRNNLVSKISGGQRKRVNIACELLTNPNVILLDEPTSGLDSATAHKLITSLKQIALEDKKTILVSIHQPPSQVFEMFDQLTLMVSGHCVFSGKTEDALGVFAVSGMICKEHYNPADFFLESLSGSQEQIDNLINHWAADGNKQKFASLKNKDDSIGDNNSVDENKKNEKESKWPIGYIEQTLILTHRSLQLGKSQAFDFLECFQTITLAVIVGFLWFQMPNTVEATADKQGLLFFVIIYSCYQTAFKAL
eukprot:Awhi_evm1s10203